jgi:hypothetical protein
VARQHHHGQIAAGTSERHAAMKRQDVPFQRHWLYYLVLKYAVIALAVGITVFTAYRLYIG